MLDNCRGRSAFFCFVLYFPTPRWSMDIILTIVVIILTLFWVSNLSSCLSCSVYIAVVISSSNFCIVTAMCRLCSGEHHFPAIGRIAYTTSCSCCEARGSVWVSHLSPYLNLMMSMTNTATASVACNPSLGDAHDLANCICILVGIQGDGMPFSPNCFQDEDLVELCMGLGQAHPDGVFQISETEALLMFQSTAKMMATMHLSCGHGVAWWTYQTPYLPSQYHPSQNLCGWEGCIPLQHPNPNPR